jgi:hypothetical protein
MSRLRSRVLTAVAAPALLMTGLAVADRAAATSTTEPDSGAVEILPPDESYAGATLGEWNAQQLQWAASLPEGFECNHGQHGPVFFVPPGFESSYDCVVPEGTAIHMAVGVNLCSSVLPPPNFGRNEEELRACLDEVGFLPGSVVTVNGQEVSDMDSRITESPVFNLYFPEYNLVGHAAHGMGLTMARGTAFIIAPPPPGDYQIVLTDLDGFSYTINVTVVAPQIIEPGGTGAPQTSQAPDVTEPPSTT